MTSLVFLFSICISVTYGIDVYWPDFNGTAPTDAIIHEGNLLIGQVLIGATCCPQGSILPGPFYPKTHTVVTNACDVTLNITDKQRIKILCSSQPWRFYWESVNVESLTEDKINSLVIGGMEANFLLYIGKVYHDHEWKMGKVFPPTSYWKGLQVWNDTDFSCCYRTMNFMILAYH